VELTAALDGYERGVMVKTRLRRAKEIRQLRIVDERGEVRLSLTNYDVERTTAGNLGRRCRRSWSGRRVSGDVGRALPAIYLLRACRIASYEGLSNAGQAIALAGRGDRRLRGRRAARRARRAARFVRR